MYRGLGFTQQIPPCGYFDLKGFPGYKTVYTRMCVIIGVQSYKCEDSTQAVCICSWLKYVP